MLHLHSGIETRGVEMPVVLGKKDSGELAVDEIKHNLARLRSVKDSPLGLPRRDSNESDSHDSGIELTELYETLTLPEDHSTTVSSKPASTDPRPSASLHWQRTSSDGQLEEVLLVLTDRMTVLFAEHAPIKTAAPASRSESESSASLHRLSTTQSKSSLGSISSASSYSKRSSRGDDDDAEEEDRHEKRARFEDDQDAPLQATLFACPYSKYDPYRYSPQNLRELRYRGCWSAYLTSIPNVKQHLYRKHKRPEHYCPCCFEEFNDHQALENHTRRRSCISGHCTFAERMTADQEAQVKKRTPGVDLAEKWYNIYRVLFPSHGLPDNPWAEFGNAPSTDDFIAFFDREAPRQLSSLITTEYANFFPSDEALQEFLNTALQRSLSTMVSNMHSTYRASDRNQSSMEHQDVPIFNGLQLPSAGAPPQHQLQPNVATILPQAIIHQPRRPTMNRDAMPQSSCSVATIRGLTRPVTAPPQSVDTLPQAPIPPHETYFIPEWSFIQSNQYVMPEMPLEPVQQQYQMYNIDGIGAPQQSDSDMTWTDQPRSSFSSDDTHFQGSYSGRVEDWLFSRGGT